MTSARMACKDAPAGRLGAKRLFGPDELIEVRDDLAQQGSQRLLLFARQSVDRPASELGRQAAQRADFRLARPGELQPHAAPVARVALGAHELAPQELG